MGLNDRLTNGKSYSHSGGLCCKERLEDTVLVFSVYTCPRILNRDHNTVRILNNIGPYPQDACSTGNGTHSFDGVHNQI